MLKNIDFKWINLSNLKGDFDDVKAEVSFDGSVLFEKEFSLNLMEFVLDYILSQNKVFFNMI